MIFIRSIKLVEKKGGFKYAKQYIVTPNYQISFLKGSYELSFY